MTALDVFADFRKLLLCCKLPVCEMALRANVKTKASHIGTRRHNLGKVISESPSAENYFSFSNEFSNCSNLAWLTAIVFAGPVNLMNTFPPGPSIIAPSSR